MLVEYGIPEGEHVRFHRNVARVRCNPRSSWRGRVTETLRLQRTILVEVADRYMATKPTELTRYLTADARSSARDDRDASLETVHLPLQLPSRARRPLMRSPLARPSPTAPTDRAPHGPPPT